MKRNPGKVADEVLRGSALPGGEPPIATLSRALLNGENEVLLNVSECRTNAELLLALGLSATGTELVTALTAAAQRAAIGAEPVSVFETVFAYDGSYYRIPATLKTSTGRLFAACEKRPSTSDDGAIGIAFKTSDDGGKTWSAQRDLFPYSAPWAYGNPTFVPTLTSRVFIIFHRHHVDDTRALLAAGTSTDKMRLYKSYTDDDGDTWSTAEEITSVEEVGHNMQNVGTGSGICLADGTMLVCKWTQANGSSNNDRTTGVMRSTDNGTTWAYIEAGSGYEGQVVWAGGNNIRLNFRPALANTYNRGIYTSSNKGTTWSAASYDAQLPDPSNSASEIRLANGRHLFVNTPTREYRGGLGLRHSEDSGTTWSGAFLMDTGTVNYSQLVQVDDVTGGVLYEGVAGSYIYFHTFHTEERAGVSIVGETLYRSSASGVEFGRAINPTGSAWRTLIAGTHEYRDRAYSGSETTLDAGGGGWEYNTVTGGPHVWKVGNVRVASLDATSFVFGVNRIYGGKNARKTSNQTLANSTTLTNDSDLTFAFLTGETWRVQIRGNGQCAAAGGVKIACAWSQGVSGSALGGIFRLSDRATGAILDVGLPDEELTTVGTYTQFLFEADIEFVASASGTFNFKFAQNTSNGTNTIISGGSFLAADRRG